MPKVLDKILFAGSSDPGTAKRLSEKANIYFGKILIRKFSSGEKYINLIDEVKNKIVYIYQTGVQNPDEILFEIFLIADAAKRAGAKKIILIISFLLYSRQEKKTSKDSQEPVSAEVLAKLFEISGIDELITVHIHSQKILGFYKIKVKNIETEEIFAERIDRIIKKYREPNSKFVIVSPDKGGINQAERLAQKLGNLKVFYFEKKRKDPSMEINISKPLEFYGDVLGKRVIIFDDIIDTGGTVIKAKMELIKKGALEVILCVTHPVLSDDALGKLTKANFSRIIVSDSVPLKKESQKFEVISLVDELAKYL